ncbi:MAG: sodium:solute symporter family protein, partial [Actinobacteria bacterium]|nr:sodium:solute symporter family protein [Actinomycetota bacterium]
AYGAIVQLAPITVVALFWRRASAAGVLTGLIVGSLVTLFLFYFPEYRPFGIHEGIVGLSINCLLLVAISLTTRPVDPDHVDAFVEASLAAAAPETGP